MLSFLYGISTVLCHGYGSISRFFIHILAFPFSANDFRYAHIKKISHLDQHTDITGEQHSVREFCQLAFHDVGIELEFVGEGMNEKGIDKATGKTVIEVSPDFYRPTDVVNLWGDPSKARRELGWNPTKTTFEQLVKIMVDHDMKKVAVERAEEHIKTNLAEYLEKGVIK